MKAGGSDYENDGLSVNIGSVETTPEQDAAARLTVCELARDVPDARHLLDVLGLMPDRAVES